jgi:hypothetical protein
MIADMVLSIKFIERSDLIASSSQEEK